MELSTLGATMQRSYAFRVVMCLTVMKEVPTLHERTVRFSLAEVIGRDERIFVGPYRMEVHGLLSGEDVIFIFP